MKITRRQIRAIIRESVGFDPSKIDARDADYKQGYTDGYGGKPAKVRQHNSNDDYNDGHKAGVADRKAKPGKRGRQPAERSLVEQRQSRAILHIIRRNGGRRLPRDHQWGPKRYEFSSDRDASNAVWEISDETGRECASSGRILTVYT